MAVTITEIGKATFGIFAVLVVWPALDLFWVYQELVIDMFYYIRWVFGATLGHDATAQVELGAAEAWVRRRHGCSSLTLFGAFRFLHRSFGLLLGLNLQLVMC